jgi:hypothetical protein
LVGADRARVELEVAHGRQLDVPVLTPDVRQAQVGMKAEGDRHVRGLAL